jgi:CheY-like chemotaxis protein
MEPEGIVPGISVLVVDDNEAIREAVAVILLEHGYRANRQKTGLRPCKGYGKAGLTQ